jgi:hypothetical protein
MFLLLDGGGIFLSIPHLIRSRKKEKNNVKHVRQITKCTRKTTRKANREKTKNLCAKKLTSVFQSVPMGVAVSASTTINHAITFTNNITRYSRNQIIFSESIQAGNHYNK